MSKKFYLSKTLWVNAIAVIANLVAKQFGIEIDGATQVSILGVINFCIKINH